MPIFTLMPLTQPKRVAIIGGGCAGVTCFWALQDSIHDVHLFEASSSLGGRIKTFPFEYGKAQAHVDTQSPCFNAEASPNFVSLLRYLGTSTSSIPLIFGASNDTGTYQWRCGLLENVLLRPWWSLCSLETWRVLFDIVRLKYLSLDVLMDRPSFNQKCNSQQSPSVHDYLSNEGFSSSFRDKYLAPLLSTLWATNAGRFLPRLSIKFLADFLHDNKLLCILKSLPHWRRVNITASQFIQRMADGFPSSRIHVGTRVQAVNRTAKNNHTLLMCNGEQMEFDHVIFAVDSQTTLRLLESAINAEEKKILQDIGTTRNIAVLHSDSRLIPNAQACPCNYTLISSSDNPNNNNNNNNNNNHHDLPNPSPPKACLTYNINILQNIPALLFGPISITVNPFTPPHPRLVQAVWEFTDTEISTTTLDAHRCLPSIQNKNGLSFCSVWTGRGFFEDAVTGALRVAVEHLAAEVPFNVDLHYRGLKNDGDEYVGQEELSLDVWDHLVLTALGLLRVYVQAFELLLALWGFFWIWVRVRRNGAWKRS